MHVFLRDAMGPDERGKSTHVTLEHALVNGELEVVAYQDYWVLVVITDYVSDWWRIAVNVVRIKLLLQNRGFGGFLKSLVWSEMITGTVRDGPVWGLVVRVHYLVIFV